MLPLLQGRKAVDAFRVVLHVSACGDELGQGLDLAGDALVQLCGHLGERLAVLLGEQRLDLARVVRGRELLGDLAAQRQQLVLQDLPGLDRRLLDLGNRLDLFDRGMGAPSAPAPGTQGWPSTNALPAPPGRRLDRDPASRAWRSLRAVGSRPRPAW